MISVGDLVLVKNDAERISFIAEVVFVDTNNLVWVKSAWTGIIYCVNTIDVFEAKNNEI